MCLQEIYSRMRIKISRGHNSSKKEINTFLFCPIKYKLLIDTTLKYVRE